MASRSDVVKKIMRFKLLLLDTAEPVTVLKILQKLRDLDITLDILAETGIGKTVNSLRRHKQAGEFAKSLVKGWKKLVPKESISGHGEVLSETTSVKNKDDQSYTENGSLPIEDVNGNHLTFHGKNHDSSDEAPFETWRKNTDLEKGHCEEKIKAHEKRQQEENCRLFQKNNFEKNRAEIKEDKMDKPAVSRQKKNSDALFGKKNLEGTDRKSRSDCREKQRGRLWSDKELNTKSKPSKESTVDKKESFSSGGKPSKRPKVAKDDGSLEISRSSEAKSRKRKETEKRDTLKHKPDSENSKDKKIKIKHKNAESRTNEAEHPMSFESYLNYDVYPLKRKEQSGVKKSKKIKTAAKQQPANKSSVKPVKSPAASPEQKVQDSLKHLMDVPLPATLPDLEKPSSVDYYFEKKAEKEPDFGDVSEESPVFTGQRLNRKMQVYSGAKTLFLPTMMSLYQQCIRTLQNNINLLHETGGVPFELLEPVLERCTPEQLLRIEECNPIYVGETDHLWGKHCQRDFKNYKLQEYESWRELYLRLSEERERKFQRLTKTIVSAQSKKPKGRQVKMAFIHTVAKPPRDVRIQQEIHGTAVQQPHQLKCGVKILDNRSRPSCNEPSRSSSTSSGGSNTQDSRKKTKVAPMMAKSLKAFKKQLGRR